MKKNLLFLLLILSTIMFGQSNFSNGFSDGYKKGYCQNQGIGCMSPLPPIAPIPKIGENMNSYQDGYNRGFEAGLNSQKSSNNSNSTRERFKAQSIELSKDNIYNPYENIQGAIALANALRESKGQALEYLEEEEYQKAANIAYTGLSVSPKDNEFMLILGQAFKGVNDNVNAVKWFRKALSNGFNDNNDNLKNLIIKLENNSTEANSQKYEENKSKDLENLKTEYVNYFKNGNYTKALEIANKINAINPGFNANYILGITNFYVKDYPNAIKYFSLALQENEIVSILYYRAISKDNIEDVYGAISDYNKIIEIVESGKENFQNMATVYNNKAYCLTKQNKFSEALPFVEKALNLDKNLGYIWDTKGEILYNLGDYNQSIIAMNEAIKIEENSNSYFFRGLSNIKLKKKDLGCKDLSKAGELGKKSAYEEIKKYCN